jgi:hypothetical protein
VLIQDLAGKHVIGRAGLGNMKITELFNNPKEPIDSLLGTSKEKEDEKDKGSKFDLDDDLIFFMHNNDDFYRRNLFPVLKVCKNKFDHGGGFSHRMFKPIVAKAYESYRKEFPLRELEDKLDEEQCEAIARKIYEMELGNMKDGKYE